MSNAYVVAALAGTFLVATIVLSQCNEGKAQPIPLKRTGQGEILTGQADAVDGDTIHLNGRRIRLFGIDAPEIDQTCNGWAGGLVAKNKLDELIGRAPVLCEVMDRDRYNRDVAVCWNYRRQELNRVMVEEGLAVAYVYYTNRYVEDMRIAKAQGVNVWQHGCQNPAQWRREHKSP
jgi:endonuclease YncB( thermonuclease family)